MWQSHLLVRQLPEQLPGQLLGRRRDDLSALAAYAGGDGGYVPCYPVGSLERLATDLDGYGVVGWGLVHRCLTVGDRIR